jgi:hypothetical protein
MARLTERLQGYMTYRDALKKKDDNDFFGSDACALGISQARASYERRNLTQPHELEDVYRDASTEHPMWPEARDAHSGDRVAFGGRVIADVPGMGKVYDWRNTAWSQPNGGKIPLLLFVDHIPVIPQMPGIADFIRLRDVLYAQGLRVQTSTDGSGNVALFTPFNRLCYQARGANSFSMGCEHMHYSTGEPWTRHQLNASSYVHWMAREHHGLRANDGQLASGNGIVRVVRKGRTSHRLVSAYAGYNDRSDPGDKPQGTYDKEHVLKGVVYYDRHHSFKGF